MKPKRAARKPVAAISLPDADSRAQRPQPPANEGSEPLTFSISPSARQRLAVTTRNSFWTPDSVIEQLIMDHLHNTYPVVRYRNVVLAPAGTFRAFDRRSHRPCLVFLTSAGRYQISVRPENRDYQRLCHKYQDRGSANAETEAAEMCLFKLQTYLADCSEESKIIYPEDFLVQQIVEREAKEVLLPASDADATESAPLSQSGIDTPWLES